MALALLSTRRVSGLVLLSLIFLIDCSRQGEGERCSTRNANDDCDSGLVCVSADELRGGEADRCCPPEGQAIGDERCTRGPGGGATGGADAGPSGGAGGGAGSGTGGSAPGGNGGGSADAGQGCRYNSECPVGQQCGPAGVCQAECVEDRDCDSPEVCVSGVCELPTADAGVAGAGGAD